MSATPVASFPVAVMMSRKLIRRGAWSLPHWEALAVLSGEQFEGLGRSRSLVHEDGELQHHLFRGFRLELYRDAAETYWWNLTGESPSLYVICMREQGEELIPISVTADHEEAQGAVERDALAFAVAIPADIHDALERVVLEHYRPEAPRKRRRQHWDQEGSE